MVTKQIEKMEHTRKRIFNFISNYCKQRELESKDYHISAICQKRIGKCHYWCCPIVREIIE